MSCLCKELGKMVVVKERLEMQMQREYGEVIDILF